MRTFPNVRTALCGCEFCLRQIELFEEDMYQAHIDERKRKLAAMETTEADRDRQTQREPELWF
jgi:hypothetical protein